MSQLDLFAARQPAETRLGLTVGSLFSGIGGLDLGISGRVLWGAEQAPEPRAVFARRFGCAVAVDVAEALDAPRVEVIVGGFPCQDLSVAGRGAGLAGAKSGLWFAMLDVVRAHMPQYVVIENVPALVSRGLDVVVGGLADAGYDCEWTRIAAADVGAWHRRQRLFLVAWRRDLGPHRVFTGRGDLVDAARERNRAGIWGAEPEGVPRLVTSAEVAPYERNWRLKALGNAVVPQVAEVVGQCLATAERRLGPDAAPKAGMPREGRCIGGQVRALPLLAGAARSPLPTPTAMRYGSSQNGSNADRPSGGTPSLENLLRAAGGRSLLPTATSDARGSRRATARREGWASVPGTTLLDACLLATPTARDYRSGKASDATLESNARPLVEQVWGAERGSAGFLNPVWVSWLMGFPAGWLS